MLEAATSSRKGEEPNQAVVYIRKIAVILAILTNIPHIQHEGEYL